MSFFLFFSYYNYKRLYNKIQNNQQNIEIDFSDVIGLEPLLNSPTISIDDITYI
jgi:hypothetical protein